MLEFGTLPAGRVFDILSSEGQTQYWIILMFSCLFPPATVAVRVVVSYVGIFVLWRSPNPMHSGYVATLVSLRVNEDLI
jgi:hypothetical protein